MQETMQEAPTPRTPRKVASRLVDVDVHPGFKLNFTSVLPYLTREWQHKLRYLADQNPANVSVNRYPHPLGGYRGDAKPPGGGPPGSDIQFLTQDYLDRYGVDIALLLALPTVQCMAAPDAERGAAIVSAYNDYLIDKWLDDPRLRLGLAVSPIDPQLAAAEIRRHGDKRGIAAVFLHLTNIRLGNRHYYPIFEAAIEYGLPIVSHIGGAESGHPTGPPLAGGLPESYVEWRVDWQQIAQSAISSLIFNGVFERYPALKVLFVEYGFTWALPHFWRLDKAWRELRSEVPWVKKWPTDYIHEHVKFASQPVDEPRDKEGQKELDRLIESHFADILVYSSDYPHWDADDPGAIFKGLSEPTKQKIFYQNAEAILRL